MTSILYQVETLFGRNDTCVLVRIVETKGSTPREPGAWMLIGSDAGSPDIAPGLLDREISQGTHDDSQDWAYAVPHMVGTIGGGQLEYLAIGHARKILEAIRLGVPPTQAITIPLGPEIGQCCGGRVELAFEILGRNDQADLTRELRKQAEELPSVFVFGAGHVGAALVRVLALMPVKTIWVDTRPGQIEAQYDRFGEDAPSGIEAHTAAVPELHVRDAPPGSAFVIMTHDHGLDYLISMEALKRADASYVGLIGSQTKRATFKNWLRRETGDDALEAKLVCPIGIDGPGNTGETKKQALEADKRPEIIALVVTREIMAYLNDPRADAS